MCRNCCTWISHEPILLTVKQLDDYIPLVYEELRRLAAHHMAGERRGHTLGVTALVNEAYLNLAATEGLRYENRAHFFGIASHVMRRILIWHARRRQAQKRGGDWQRVTLEDPGNVFDLALDDLLSIDQALTRLENVDERLCRVVECRYFGGLTIEETAGVLGVGTATVKRDWAFARTWLARALGEGGSS